MKKNCNCSCNSDELYFNNVSNIDRVIENILNELNNFKVYSDEAEVIVNSEKERVLAETKRIKAETERVQNEIERIKQEEKRQGNNKEFTENETQRLEKFKEIEDKIAEIEKSETERKNKYNEWNDKLNSFNDLSNTLNTKIEEINKTVEKINKLENTTTEDKDKLYTLIDKVDKNITDIENTTKEINSIKETNNKAIQELKASIEDIKKLGLSNEKIDTLEKDIKSLKDKNEEYDTKFAKNDINLKDLRDNEKVVDNSLKSINTKLDDYNTRITENKENVTNTENSLALAQEKIKNIENSVNKILEGSSSGTNVDVTQFNLLKSKVENNEKSLTTTNETLSTLKTKITTTSDKITQLEKDLKDKETNLENKISTTNSSISSLDEKVNSNQKSLNDKASKTDLDNKADKKHTHNISDITDLETTLSNKANTSDLENKADKIDLKTKANKVDLNNKADKTHKHNISDITNLQAELDKKSNLVELGSVNLIKNSDDLNSWVKYDGGNHTITKEFMNEFKIDGQRIKSDAANGTDFIKSYIDLNVENLIIGKTYTFSIYIKNNRDVKAQIRVQGFDWNFVYELQAKEYKRFIVTGKRVKVDGVWENKIQFQLRCADKTQYVDMTVSRPQLEEGNTVTSWSKNPNDYKDYKDDINKLKTTLDDKANKSDMITKYDLVAETDKLKNSLDKKADKSDVISKDELNKLNIKIDNFKRTVLWDYNYSKSTFSAGSFGFNYDNYIDLDKKYGDTIFTTSNSNSNITIDKSKVSNFDKSSERLLVINDDDGKYRIVQDILQAEGKMLYRAKVEDELVDSFYVSKLEQLTRSY